MSLLVKAVLVALVTWLTFSVLYIQTNCNRTDYRTDHGGFEDGSDGRLHY